MSAQNKIVWPGFSGHSYEYTIFPIGTKFTATAGNYIFAKEVSPNSYKAIYIGETGDLSGRFDSHHAMPCIERQGATHIHVHGSSNDARNRRAEESDLIRKWSPTCNG